LAVMSSRTRSTAPGAREKCREMIALLSEYIDGALPPDRARGLEAHLAICDPCVAFLESLRKTRSAVGALREEDIPEDCRRALRSFLDDKVRKPRPRRA